MLYRLLLFTKLVAVLAYAGGFAGAFLCATSRERSRAAHGIASPALLAIWVSGYLLSTQLGIALTEAWLLGALVLSLASLLALVHSVARERRTAVAFATAALPLALVLALMVWRPTWQQLRGS